MIFISKIIVFNEKQSNYNEKSISLKTYFPLSNLYIDSTQNDPNIGCIALNSNYFINCAAISMNLVLLNAEMNFLSGNVHILQLFFTNAVSNFKK